MDESPFGEAPEETAAVIAALQEEKTDDFPRAIRALRNRNFRLFWKGNFLSNIGTWMRMWPRASWFSLSPIRLSGLA